MARLWIVACTLLTFCGCPKDSSQPTARTEKQPYAGLELRLLVVEDPAIAAAAGRLRSEWQARTGSTFTVVEMPAAEFAQATAIDADAVIYPASLIGQIAERELLASVPAEVLSSEELAWSDVFETLQLAETNWSSQIVAVPFGSPVLVCMYRADLLDKLHRQPPETWAEYQSLAQTLARREELPAGMVSADAPWYGTLEPNSKDWGGRLLLARCAAYAKHRDNYSALFNMNTMQPLIDQPPFVRALEELAAAAKLGPSDRSGLNPSAVRRGFLDGHAGLALTWPSSAKSSATTEGTPPASATDKVAVGFHQLPGSADVYNLTGNRWEKRGADEAIRVTLLGIEGRVGSVPESSNHARAAFSLLAWLSGKEWSKTTAAASEATTLYRTSHFASPTAWTDAALDPAAAKQYARVVQQTLSPSTVLLAARLPGHDEYLAALDEAVSATLAGEKSAADALAEAASAWNGITDRLGRTSQRRAYLHSLGLEP